ncbi:hypothetical protein LCGC14_0276350 [marine sediment metagenome]|uniref:Uncharacterized protein n=1 Tax=marine sediment metagenome TaxID=412755 RepID=A0A0F9UE45_9ZZZZ
MSIINMALVLLTAICAFIIAALMAEIWGLGEYIGISLVIVIYLCLVGILTLIQSTLHSRRPPRPVCEDGQCHWNDYRLVGCHSGNLVWKCRCGNKYAKSGKRFLKLREDGRRRPFMVIGGHHRWEPDTRNL